MDLICREKVQTYLETFIDTPIYLHLETTNGAYASHVDESFFSASAYIRNAHITYSHGKITGTGPYRVGLKLDIGWVYGEGLTHYEIDQHNRLLLAGLDHSGKLAIAFQLSPIPFPTSCERRITP
ncbi:YojF family protein [Bacillus sp. FSL W7-1360]